MSNSIDRFVQAVNSTQGDKISLGKVSADCIVLNGRSYPAEYSAEIDIYEGKWVRVMLSGGKAVVIGE